MPRKEARDLNINPTASKSTCLCPLCPVTSGVGHLWERWMGVGHRGPTLGVRQCLRLAEPLHRCSGKATSIFSFGTSVFCEPKRVLFRTCLPFYKTGLESMPSTSRNNLSSFPRAQARYHFFKKPILPCSWGRAGCSPLVLDFLCVLGEDFCRRGNMAGEISSILSIVAVAWPPWT